MIKAKDIMTEDVVSIKQDMSAITAIERLLKWKISGMPVVDDDMNLVGIVSEKNFLRLLIKEDLEDEDQVSHYMIKDIVSFDEGEDVVVIYETLLEKPFRCVPIVKNGKLVGIISRRDMLKLARTTLLKDHTS